MAVNEEHAKWRIMCRYDRYSDISDLEGCAKANQATFVAMNGLFLMASKGGYLHRLISDMMDASDSYESEISTPHKASVVDLQDWKKSRQ